MGLCIRFHLLQQEESLWWQSETLIYVNTRIILFLGPFSRTAFFFYRPMAYLVLGSGPPAQYPARVPYQGADIKFNLVVVSNSQDIFVTSR